MAASSSSSMEQQSTVDTTSPFRSVKEAIATYGYGHQLCPPQTTQSQKADEDGAQHTGADHHRHDHDDDGDAAGGAGDFNEFGNKLKKLEDELVETKFELKLLKKKHSQTEVAIASLNAELHKNMSKIARMEANEAKNMNKHMSKSAILESRLGEEWKVKEPSKIMEEQPTLEQVLSFGVCEGYFANSNKVAKKKPIAPLITDIFVWKKSPTPKHKHKDDLAFLSPSFYSSTKYLT